MKPTSGAIARLAHYIAPARVAGAGRARAKKKGPIRRMADGGLVTANDDSDESDDGGNAVQARRRAAAVSSSVQQSAANAQLASESAEAEGYERATAASVMSNLAVR